MLIIGELINSSRKSIRAAIEAQDVTSIQAVAEEQRKAGADFIDVNAGVFVEQEDEYLKWLVSTVQESVDAPCCIDSPNPKAIKAALNVHQGSAMINSISLEKGRYDDILPLVAGTDLKVVALCISDKGIPQTVGERLTIAENLINGLVKSNIPMGNIYVDPLVQPISTNDEFGVKFLDAVEQIMTRFEGVHTICGLSNISYGLPERRLLNQAFAVMAIGKGLDALIINPLDKRMMGHIVATELLAGKDSFCEKYIKSYRDKKL